jgi:HTH-like domain
MAGEGLPVEVCCRVLAVSCAGFYAWRFRPPSAREVRHAWLTDLIREIHAASYGSYGANRVHAELVLGRGIRVGHGSVAMLMQRAGIAGQHGTSQGTRPRLKETRRAEARGATREGVRTSFLSRASPSLYSLWLKRSPLLREPRRSQV